MTPRTRRLALAAVVAGIIAVLLYPYRIAPPNAVDWLDGEPGLRFAGDGIAHGAEPILEPGSGDSLGAVTLELWLRIAPNSPNWGAREIFSLYDGRPSPPLLLGAYGERLFFFSRFEPPHDEEWFRQFPPLLRLEPEGTHFVAVTGSVDGWAFYRDGVAVLQRPSLAREALAFGGRPVLGNAPSGRRGWWGDVKGLAVYGAALPEETLVRHGESVAAHGLGALAAEPGLVALYSLLEGVGRQAADGVREGGALSLPGRFAALPRSMLHWPGDDVAGRRPFALDPFQNVLLFLPLGALLRGRLGRRVALGLALSLGLETLQLLIPIRAASTLDVAWNTLGTAMGAAGSRLWVWRRGRTRPPRPLGG